MSYRAYQPERGDLVHMNFSPSAGHEMAERHYALVLTALKYNRKSGMAVVCPVTSRVRGWPFEVPLPAGLLPDKKGQPTTSVVVSDAMRQVDFRYREMEFVAKAPREVFQEVLDNVWALLEDE